MGGGAGLIFSVTTKNTKPHEMKRVVPNAIRYERSEQKPVSGRDHFRLENRQSFERFHCRFPVVFDNPGLYPGPPEVVVI